MRRRKKLNWDSSLIQLQIHWPTTTGRGFRGDSMETESLKGHGTVIHDLHLNHIEWALKDQEVDHLPPLLLKLLL